MCPGVPAALERTAPRRVQVFQVRLPSKQWPPEPNVIRKDLLRFVCGPFSDPGFRLLTDDSETPHLTHLPSLCAPRLSYSPFLSFAPSPACPASGLPTQLPGVQADSCLCHHSSDFPGTLGTYPRDRQSQEEAKTARSPGGEAGDDRVCKAPRNLRIQLRSSARGTLRYGRGKACTGSPSEQHPWDLSGLSPQAHTFPTRHCLRAPGQPDRGAPGAHPSCCARVGRSSRRTA